MLLRFSLYGFFKNQRYFEPFLVLIFLDRGLSFFQIGLLVGFRELVVNALEIPSGAFADVAGRRFAMVLSFVAYFASFLIFPVVHGLPLLYGAMLLYAVGDAFRTGTHKAMIFAWLKSQGREQERTRVYGYTRSWSKLGSALSVVIGAAVVFHRGDYDWLFYCATVPCALNILNFLGYQRSLDRETTSSASVREVARHLVTALKATSRSPALRRLVAESTGFEGVFAAAKDYLQPLLLAVATATIVASELNEVRRTALLVGSVYLVLFLLSALASRQAHRVAAAAGSEDAAARRLWIAALFIYSVIALGGWLDLEGTVVAAFVALYVLQNLWRPLLVSRFDRHAESSQGATVLSIESQARRIGTMIAAPLIGLAVDAVRTQHWGGSFWPVGVTGLLVALGFLASSHGRRAAEQGARGNSRLSSSRETLAGRVRL